MPDYSLTSLQIPPIQGAGTIINVDDAAPVVAEGIAQGDATGVVARTQRTAARVDVAARYGLGAPAVLNGLDLSSGSGLTLNISAGQANIDGVTPQDADPSTARTLALTGGGVGVTIYNYIWLSRGGTFNKTTSSDPNAPASPPGGGPWLYLGRITIVSDAQTAIDYSGRMTLLRGSLPMMRTADVGPPAWTPPSDIRYWHRTATGLYLWDGEALRLWEESGMPKTSVASGETLYVPAGRQLLMFGSVDWTAGAVKIDGAFKLLGGDL